MLNIFESFSIRNFIHFIFKATSKDLMSKSFIPPSFKSLYNVSSLILLLPVSHKDSFKISEKSLKKLSLGDGKTESKYEMDAPPKLLIITFLKPVKCLPLER